MEESVLKMKEEYNNFQVKSLTKNGYKVALVVER